MNKREEEILVNLYRFRFLTRGQLQNLLGHKNHRCLVDWLKELLSKNYIGCLDRRGKITDSYIYFLENNGRKYLKNLELNKKGLNKVWRNSKTSKQQQDHCLAVADAFVVLDKMLKEVGEELFFYTKTELIGYTGLVTPHADAYFYIKNKKGFKNYYFLDIFNAFVNKWQLIKRLDKYQDYYDENIWQEEVKKDFPEVILVLSDVSSYFFLKKYLPKIIENYDFSVYIISLDMIRNKGFNKETLTKIEPADD